MDIAQLLAETCVGVQLIKTAADLPGLRDRFENLAAEERLLRTHAQRLEQLAKERAEQEDTSLGGYAETAVKRTLPVPHSPLEAAIRIPGMLAGGIAGYGLGKSTEPLAADDVLRAVAPLRQGAAADSLPLRRNLAELAGARGQSSSAANDVVTALRAADPGDAGKALRARGIFTAEQKKLRDTLEKALGSGGVKAVRGEIENVVRQSGSKSIAEKAVGALNWRRTGGAVGGALAGGALAGLPFLARALYLKRHGGEAAEAARGKARTALESAGSKAQEREKVVEEAENA